MALMECRYFSDALGMAMTMNVILPQKTQRQIGLDGDNAPYDNLPTLFLLHGLSDDHSAWLRHTNIERYAARHGIAVVMPCTHRGWYTNAVSGYAYWTHLSEEVPRIARSFFRLSEEREDTFVAGLSMGGFGAFKLATLRPDLVCAAASLSGVMDISARFAAVIDKELLREMEAVFGPLDQLAGTENDLITMTRQLADSASPRPKLLQCCGTEDILYAMNQRYRDAVEPLTLDYTYEETPGSHTWSYWDEAIQRVLRWLPLRRGRQA